MSTANEKPEPPHEWECCESGCSPCVWDHYYEKVRLWEEQRKAADKAISDTTERECSGLTNPDN